MSIADIRKTIAEAVDPIIPCQAYMPPVIHAPAAFILPKSGNWNVTLPREISNIVYELDIILGIQGVIQETQTNLDSYLEATTSQAIKYAIESADYGTSASFVQVTGWRDYGPITINETNYLGVKLDISTY